MVSPNLIDAGKMMAKKKPKKFIQDATKNAHGQFREKAEKAGKSTAEFAKEHEHSPGLLGKQARLAETLMGLHHGKEKTKHRGAKEVRRALYGKD